VRADEKEQEEVGERLDEACRMTSRERLRKRSTWQEESGWRLAERKEPVDLERRKDSSKDG
jgi:hypothetical protein